MTIKIVTITCSLVLVLFVGARLYMDVTCTYNPGIKGLN
jgi:hypothetical protein